MLVDAIQLSKMTQFEKATTFIFDASKQVYKSVVKIGCETTM